MTTKLFPLAALGAILALSIPVASAADADKAATPVKPHSHIEEKGGVPQKPAADKPAKPKPNKKQAKHLHPRDAK